MVACQVATIAENNPHVRFVFCCGGKSTDFVGVPETYTQYQRRIHQMVNQEVTQEIMRQPKTVRFTRHNVLIIDGCALTSRITKSTN